MEYTSGSELADIGGLLGSLGMDYLQTGKLPEVGKKVLRPDKSWKAADVAIHPNYSGPIVFIPMSPITRENADNPDLFANKHQTAPNGLSRCQGCDGL